MGKTKIQWTEETWNPVVGCSKVSSGCKNCYAIRHAQRLAANPNPKIGPVYQGLTKDENWTGVVRLVAARLVQPLRWRKPRRVFANSMSDLFHEALSFEDIAAVFGVMAAAPAHTFQILTKRPARMLEWFAWVARRAEDGLSVFPGDDEGWRVRQLLQVSAMRRGVQPPPHHGGPWPLPNVWIGVSVEDQRTADERIPLLLQAPAAIRFLSCEPLLGPVDLEHHLFRIDRNGEPSGPRCNPDGSSSIGWVIVGGESGAGHKTQPMHPQWARDLRDQCIEIGVPFFFKQWGAWEEHPQLLESRWVDIDGRMRVRSVKNPLEPRAPGEVLMAPLPGSGGRELDGRTWDEMPERRP